MGTRKQHCEDCARHLGKSFNEVHAWLDGLASPKRGYLNVNHRRYRHHEEALETIRDMFGEQAVEAARRHLRMDFGKIPTRKEIEQVFPDKLELISFKTLNSN